MGAAELTVVPGTAPPAPCAPDLRLDVTLLTPLALHTMHESRRLVELLLRKLLAVVDVVLRRHTLPLPTAGNCASDRPPCHASIRHCLTRLSPRSCIVRIVSGVSTAASTRLDAEIERGEGSVWHCQANCRKATQLPDDIHKPH